MTVASWLLAAVGVGCFTGSVVAIEPNVRNRWLRAALVATVVIIFIETGAIP